MEDINKLEIDIKLKHFELIMNLSTEEAKVLVVETDNGQSTV